MSYASKKQVVRDVHQKVFAGLDLIPMVQYRENYRGLGFISILDDTTNQFNDEAILNVFIKDDEVMYRVTNYPNSDIPFAPREAKVDYDEDGIVEVSDVIAIAVELYGKLNE